MAKQVSKPWWFAGITLGIFVFLLFSTFFPYVFKSAAGSATACLFVFCFAACLFCALAGPRLTVWQRAGAVAAAFVLYSVATRILLRGTPDPTQIPMELFPDYVAAVLGCAFGVVLYSATRWRVLTVAVLLGLATFVYVAGARLYTDALAPLISQSPAENPLAEPIKFYDWDGYEMSTDDFNGKYFVVAACRADAPGSDYYAFQDLYARYKYDFRVMAFLLGYVPQGDVAEFQDAFFDPAGALGAYTFPRFVARDHAALSRALGTGPEDGVVWVIRNGLILYRGDAQGAGALLVGALR